MVTYDGAMALSLDQAALEAWPRPIASLLTRAQLATDPKSAHDLLLSAWEATLRLLVAASPPADPHDLSEPSLGHWVKALPDSSLTASSAALHALRTFWREQAGASRIRSSSLTLRQLVEYLPAYRNRVHGHGAPRPDEFYQHASELLLHGLLDAQRNGLLWTERLLGIESIRDDQPGDRRARCVSLMGAAVMLAAPARPVGPSECAGRLYLESQGELRPLFPWVLRGHGADRNRLLFFNGSRNGLAYLDYETGETLREKDLRALAIPFEDLLARASAADASPALEASPSSPYRVASPSRTPLVTRTPSPRRRRLARALVGVLALVAAGTWVYHQRSLALEDWLYRDQRQGWGWSDRCWNHLHAGRLAAADAACRRGLAVAPAGAQSRRSLNYNLGLLAEKRGDAHQAALWTARALTVERHPEIVAALERMCVAGGSLPRPPGEARPRKVTTWEGPSGNTLRQGPSQQTTEVQSLPAGICAWAERPSDPTSPWIRLDVQTQTKTLSGWMHQDILLPRGWAEPGR